MGDSKERIMFRHAQTGNPYITNVLTASLAIKIKFTYTADTEKPFNRVGISH